MFSAFQTFGRLGAGARAVAAAWTPAALWPTGTEPGMWIDPSNLTSQWQDSAGTTPVATPGTVADSANPAGLSLDIRAGATALADPGNHMLQASTTARPLESAYDGQTLGPGNTYDATGITPFQLYDGTDDGMATATFAAGTLIDGMDCLIAVRRDSASNTVSGLYQELGIAFGQISGAAAAVSNEASGSSTVWVDGVQLAGGTSVTQTTMNDAVTVGDWHIVEWRGLNLSAWTRAGFGGFGYGYNFNGARGDIMLFPSPADATERDKARQYLADKYGVTLP